MKRKSGTGIPTHFERQFHLQPPWNLVSFHQVSRRYAANATQKGIHHQTDAIDDDKRRSWRFPPETKKQNKKEKEKEKEKEKRTQKPNQRRRSENASRREHEMRPSRNLIGPAAANYDGPLSLSRTLAVHPSTSTTASDAT